MRCLSGNDIYLLVMISAFIWFTGCGQKTVEHNIPELNKLIALETRLESADFSIIDTNEEAVAISWESLRQGERLPSNLYLEFSGTDIILPLVSPDNAIGITHSSGRVTAVYPIPEPDVPDYGEIIPIAVAHYIIPNPEMDIILLFVCFQSDPDGAISGIGVNSVNQEGESMSAPFALALPSGDLAGMFFYDEFIQGSNKQAVAGREEWDQGFLLLTRLDPEIILSTYLPWY